MKNIIPTEWTEKSYKKFQKQLYSLQDKKYLDFNKKIISTSYEMIGIRAPIIRNIAKAISKTNIKAYLDFTSHNTYEEILLEGVVISYLKDKENFCHYFNKFILYIDNWAICDMVVSSLKIVKENKTYFYPKIKKYLQSDKEYIKRVGIIMLMDFYLDDDNIEEVFKLIDNLSCNQYYVNMAIAWLISIAYIKYKKKTIYYLKHNNLNKFTHNKAIQKIKESNRVSKEDKLKVEKLKNR